MAEAGGTLQTISDHLDCSICEDRLSDPKDLDCSHTFCRKCLYDYAQSRNSTTELSCPICRQNTTLPPGGITSLKTSYLLRNLVNDVPLEDDVGISTRSNNSLVNTESSTCSVHDGVARDIYCETCNVLVCHKCLGTGHCSTGHRHYKLNIRASYAREFLKTLSVQTVDKLADLESLDEQVDDVETDLLNNRRKTIESIDDGLAKALSNLTRQHASFIAEINKRYLADTDSLNQDRFRFERLRKRLQTHHDEAQTILESQDDRMTVLAEHKLPLMQDMCRGMNLQLQSSLFDFQITNNSLGALNCKPQRTDIAVKRVNVRYNWEECGLIGGDGFKYGVAVSSCGSILAAPKGHTVQLFHIESRQLIYSLHGTFQERLQSPTGVVFLRNGTMAISDKAIPYIRFFSQEGEFLGKFSTLEAGEDESTTRVKLSCIAIDIRHNILVVGDRKRKVLTFHEGDGTYIQTLYLDGEPKYVSVNASVCLVAVSYINGVNVLSFTGKKMLTINNYGDSPWPLGSQGVCFHSNSQAVFISRSMPFGEKSILQYEIPSGKYIGCVMKGFFRPEGLTHFKFFGSSKIAIANGTSIKILVNSAETEV